MSEPLLVVDRLTKVFGGVTAVNACSFEVQPGTITALIGPNGSGKTTVFNMITGYLKPDSGTIRFRGETIARPKPAQLYRRGLSRTFQQARIFPELSVEENLVVAAGYSWTQLFGRRISRRDRDRAAKMLTEFRLESLAHLPAAELSYGQRKLLEFAAVLASDPVLVLLDEPTAGVNPVMIDTMEQHIRQRHADGVTFLVVEHDMQLVMRLCDPVIVLDQGAPIAFGTPEQVQSDPLVLRPTLARNAPDTDVLLKLTGVTAGYGAGLILKGVDLDVRSGQIVCLIGPNGAGKSTVLKTISGLLRHRDGSVAFAGEDIGSLTSRQRLERGIVHVPQDRSLFPGMTVAENVMMGAFILTDQALVRRRMDEVAELFPIVARRRTAHAGSLSGGEQKQVELARSLMLDPALILLDEPSIGLDPKSRTSVFASISALAADGRTVLLVEQNARSGLAVAHQAAVLEAGRVALTGTGKSLLDDPEVARLYLGASARTASAETSRVRKP